MKIASNLLENLLALINVAEEDEVVNRGISGHKLKKLKSLTKFKNATKLFKSENIGKIVEFLTFEAKEAFIKLR